MTFDRMIGTIRHPNSNVAAADPAAAKLNEFKQTHLLKSFF
jgi:hypothetical protein